MNATGHDTKEHPATLVVETSGNGESFELRVIADTEQGWLDRTWVGIRARLDEVELELRCPALTVPPPE